MKIPLWDRFRKRDLVGLDLGASGVKILRLEGGAGRLGCWFFPEPVLEEQEAGIPSFLEFLKAHGLEKATVACNIEDPSLKIRRVDLPKMPDFDLREAVRWQLRDVVEGPVSDFIVRYSVLEEFLTGETKKLSLVVFAVKKAVIHRRTEFLKKLSLDPVVVEPTSVSLLAAFDRLRGWQKGEFYGLIDFGEAKSIFTAMGEGKLFFSRPLVGVSGHDLQGLLQKELALSPADADRLKRDLMQGRASESRLAGVRERAESLLPTFYAQTSLEIQRSIDAFSLMFRKEKILQLFLCGGGATLSGLTDSLTKNLAVPTGLLDPSTQFSMMEEEVPAHLFDAALGLALHPL